MVAPGKADLTFIDNIYKVSVWILKANLKYKSRSIVNLQNPKLSNVLVLFCFQNS